MDRISIHIVRNLYHRGYIGRRHTNVAHLKQGLPKHLRDMRVIKGAVKELRKAGLVLVHKKGEQVSLNYSGESVPIINQIINAPRTGGIVD